MSMAQFKSLFSPKNVKNAKIKVVILDDDENTKSETSYTVQSLLN